MNATKWSLLAATALMFLACGCASKKQHTVSDEAMAMAKNTTYDMNGTRDAPPPNPTWTCPMHPQIRQSSPGTCSICGMNLVRSDTSAHTGSSSHSGHSGSSHSGGSCCH